ncbi:DUF4167 domain-containing protein [Phyllobacterium leguminum]|uniref:Uncharacterized protein DUF4167 n=1 Tax=Phyllobacterium leguminum TaxID=314237 RepID=A0A318T2S3_9HYPH|nr:DUF4167 domain-containing protein [Phyllobacterium leguminum]PYE88906.1 uncharacterized protein DUF4167 [Phyllobacterium leguminum]
MRPGQQNRRMRGRGNNNRKGPNPLSRNYESNGPDVKIRGNAQHVAEKYMTLARDAQVSGDRVMAENYLQHAEHYNRIIMAAQANEPVQTQRAEAFDDEMDDDEDGFEQPVATVAVAPKPINGSGPQPVIEGTPAEVVFGGNGAETQRQPGDRRGPNRLRRPRNERFSGGQQAPIEVNGNAAQPSISNEEASPAASIPVQASAPVETNTPVEASAPVEAGETRRPRRVARPRRPVVTESNGEGESPKTDAFVDANSDA